MTINFLQRLADNFVKTKKIGGSEVAAIVNDFLRYVETNYEPHRKNGGANNLTRTPIKML